MILFSFDHFSRVKLLFCMEDVYWQVLVDGYDGFSKSLSRNIVKWFLWILKLCPEGAESERVAPSILKVKGPQLHCGQEQIQFSETVLCIYK